VLAKGFGDPLQQLSGVKRLFQDHQIVVNFAAFPQVSRKPGHEQEAKVRPQGSSLLGEPEA
jgi:hypothetical protein